jgi:hypothetical protein
VDSQRVHDQRTRGGDPYPQDHACISGWLYFGFENADEDTGLEQGYLAVPCKECAEASREEGE